MKKPYHILISIVVDDMRTCSTNIIESHFKMASQSGEAGRTEFLPIYWHDAIRSDAIGKADWGGGVISRFTVLSG